MAEAWSVGGGGPRAEVRLHVVCSYNVLISVLRSCTCHGGRTAAGGSRGASGRERRGRWRKRRKSDTTDNTRTCSKLILSSSDVAGRAEELEPWLSGTGCVWGRGARIQAETRQEKAEV